MDQNPQPSRSYPIGYPSPTFGARATHWKWTGQGELTLDGEHVRLTGKRRRSFWFAADQDVTIERKQIRDVRQDSEVLACTVELDGRTPEPLTLRFASAAEAEQVARSFPATRSEAHQESEAFARELAAAGTRVVVTPALVAACVVLFVIMVATGVPIVSPVGPEMVPWGTNVRAPHHEWPAVAPRHGHVPAFRSTAPGTQHVGAVEHGAAGRAAPGQCPLCGLYLFAGLAGGIASLWWNPVVNSAGASGAIFGVIGAWLALTLNPATHIPRTVAKSTAQQRAGVRCLQRGKRPRASRHRQCRPCRRADRRFRNRLASGATSLVYPGRLLRMCSCWGATAGAAVVLAALGWWLMHPNPDIAARRDFALTLDQFADQEDKAVQLQQNLYQDMQAKRISERDWALQMKSQVEPLWEIANTTARRLTPGEDASRSTAAQALQKYVQLRVDWARLAAEGVLGQDEGTMHRAAEVDAEVAAALVSVQDAFKKMKR